ncbi:hypothetical protein Poli38472_006503 [Pythium oligandrum]|uniref:Ubiquinone biosynthesis protein n=1 Tax=Pythium oligandrum TaxID=41045 RepID=A0A8K1C4Y2_PYTOL|nr:hypothetical protein Poli38472_006503 [Pythium oligandrum]|eukprot:TMW56493.1 hypothetical protein Poli38472_006503 [Pythium oligandrum]
MRSTRALKQLQRLATRGHVQTTRVTRSVRLAAVPLQQRAQEAMAMQSTRMFTTSAINEEESKTQSATEDPFVNPEKRILENALQHVGEFGWSVEALAAGAKDMGYPSVAHGMLPRGAIELVDYFMDKCHEQMREQLMANREALQAMSVTDRLKFGVRTRLQLLAPVISTWPQAMALGALPQHAPSTMQKLATLSDEIWYFAGDKSTDASWYTKRALLTGIYASTELFMLTDESLNFEETWRFLDRRVEESISLGELPRSLNDVAGMMTIGVQSLLSAAVSLAGPLSSQIVKNSPLANVPNPISAINDVVPPSVAAGLAAGLPSNPLASQPTPYNPVGGANFEPKDLHDIDAELEKLGGADSRK